MADDPWIIISLNLMDHGPLAHVTHCHLWFRLIRCMLMAYWRSKQTDLAAVVNGRWWCRLLDQHHLVDPETNPGERTRWHFHFPSHDSARSFTCRSSGKVRRTHLDLGCKSLSFDIHRWFRQTRINSHDQQKPAKRCLPLEILDFHENWFLSVFKQRYFSISK